MLKLKGDTLIEVTIAIGIFSMVAVIIVSVVNGSASGAQVALETTLAREEIDAQAEALRFIQSSYISSNAGMSASNNSKYAKLWEEITSRAKNKTTLNEEILHYNPSTCDEIYEVANLFNQGAFVINTKGLKNSDVSDIIIRPSEENEKVFVQASTYPRLIYSNSSSTVFDDGTNNDDTNKVKRVEGIHIVAVEDIDATNIVADDYTSRKQPAYYDFYIRTCWYRLGADHPSTISTVIRLYNPNIGSL